MLTNDLVSFEQPGPEKHDVYPYTINLSVSETVFNMNLN